MILSLLSHNSIYSKEDMEKRETPFTKIVFPLRVKNIELCDEIILTQQKQKVNITKKVTARKERLLVAICYSKIASTRFKQPIAIAKRKVQVSFSILNTILKILKPLELRFWLLAIKLHSFLPSNYYTPVSECIHIHYKPLRVENQVASSRAFMIKQRM